MEILNRSESRADKREIIKKAKKKAEFAKKLTPLQQEYINDLVEAAKEHATIKCISVFDCTVQTALIEKTEFNYEEIKDIVMRCGELMKEAFDALDNISFEERIMKVKSIEQEVVEDISKMIFAGKSRTEVVKKMREKYVGTGLTTQDINIYWKKGKESYEKFMSGQEELKKALNEKESIKANDIDKAVEYILEEEKEMPTIKAKGKKKVKEESTCKSIDSKFKVTNKVVKLIEADVDGECGKYQIKNGVITIKETNDAFANIPAVKNWASDKREDLLKEIEKLNKLENEVIEVITEFM